MKKMAGFLLISLIFCGIAQSNGGPDAVVYDPNTQLMWQEGEPGHMTWSESRAYCEAGEFSGFDDWRQPNLEEMQGLYQLKQKLPKVVNWYYWTATTFDENDREVWILEFSYGTAVNDIKSHSYFTRCVRSGH